MVPGMTDYEWVEARAGERLLEAEEERAGVDPMIEELTLQIQDLEMQRHDLLMLRLRHDIHAAVFKHWHDLAHQGKPSRLEIEFLARFYMAAETFPGEREEPDVLLRRPRRESGSADE